MPLPRKKDHGSSGAPVLDIMKAHVKLIDVTEHTEPFVVTKQSTSAQFWLDPQFKCSVEVINDFDDGTANGTKFFESFRYKKDRDGDWINSENSKLGMLTNIVKPDYFEDESISALTADDLEGFEMICRIKPKKNPNTGQVTGSTIDWETMRPLPKKMAVTAAPAELDEIEEDFDDGSLDDAPF
jgi:hypothetical protein